MSFMSGLGGGVRRGVDPVLRESRVRGRLVVCSEQAWGRAKSAALDTLSAVQSSRPTLVGHLPTVDTCSPTHLLTYLIPTAHTTQRCNLYTHELYNSYIAT